MFYPLFCPEQPDKINSTGRLAGRELGECLAGEITRRPGVDSRGTFGARRKQWKHC